MSAIITDQFRILNAETFIKSFTGVGGTANNYYTFLGHPDPTRTLVENYGDSNWAGSPPDPRDSFEQENLYYDSMMFLKKIGTSDVSRVVRRINWTVGTTYDVYKGDVDINKASLVTNAKSLYDSNYYVINSEYKVYVCISNGANPERPEGEKSLFEPNFVATSVSQAGAIDDGYRWKYLYTLTPSEIIKFTTDDFMPVPSNWGAGETAAVKDAAVDGKIEHVIIKARGSGYQKTGGSSTATIDGVPILGNGTGGTVTVQISGGEVSSVVIQNGGSGYTRGLIRFDSETVADVAGGGAGAEFEVIIPPKGGHGADVYRELGAYRVMMYSKYDNEDDYVTGNTFSRVGVVKNPLQYDGAGLFTDQTATALGALKLKSSVGSGTTAGTVYTVNSQISQTVAVGQTAIGYVASWNPNTGVLRYYQPVGFVTSTYEGTAGNRLYDFAGTEDAAIQGAASGTPLVPDIDMDNVSALTVSGSVVQLGQTFNDGHATPEIKKYSGEIIYIDNRAPITRSASQKEEVKVVVEF
tara:strand:- start:1396 stop:2970 length:1575 start_codon:yes stop_codon:yes gene_type:complete